MTAEAPPGSEAARENANLVQGVIAALKQNDPSRASKLISALNTDQHAGAEVREARLLVSFALNMYTEAADLLEVGPFNLHDPAFFSFQLGRMLTSIAFTKQMALFERIDAAAPNSLPLTEPLVAARALFLCGQAAYAKAVNLIAQAREGGISSARLLHRHAAASLALNALDAAENSLVSALLQVPDNVPLRRDLVGISTVRQSREFRLRIMKPRSFLTISACLKNEGDNLLEWLVFHKLMGCDRFVLYDNDSTDQTVPIIDAFARHHPVVLHKVPGELGQAAAYHHLTSTYRDDSEWCALIDGDEYLTPTAEENILSFLDQQQQVAALVVHWVNFGSNGHAEKPSALCIESFTRRAPDAFPDHHVIKSIVRLRDVVSYLHPHQCSVAGLTVDVSGKAVQPIDGWCRDVQIDGLRLNHYYTKSREQMMRKRARGRPLAAGSPERVRAMQFFTDRDRNDVEDRSAARFASRVREHMLAAG